jgi:putative DNA primase/helicase
MRLPGAVCAGGTRTTQSIGTLLLADIRQIFAEAGIQRISSKELVEELCSLTDRPWKTAYRNNPITEMWLARQLREFEISPKTLRVGQTRAKGYELPNFTNAFTRFLDGGPATK